MSFDPEAIRAQFPILQRQVNGQPLVYLDSAASAQKPDVVLDAMRRATHTAYANVHRGLHTLANETTDAYEAARARVARFIGAEPSEIVFTRGATEAINLVAASLGQSFEAGDEVVLTQAEHHANIVPWHFLRASRGAVVRFAPILDDGRLDLDALGALIGSRTRVVAVNHMSNVTGVINPVTEIAAMTHAAGALCLVDGCQSIVHQAVDVKDLDVDFYVFSGHKLYGPTGIGALFGKADVLAAMPPWQGGGEMIESVSEAAITFAEPPHRFEAGTPAILEAIGLAAAIDWLEDLDREAIAAHESGLYERVKSRLDGANWISELGAAPVKGPIFAFNVEGAHAHDIAQLLDRYGVAVRAGSHCAEPLMRRFGVTSSARASFGLYNTLDEADAFVDALHRTRTFFS